MPKIIQMPLFFSIRRLCFCHNAFSPIVRCRFNIDVLIARRALFLTVRHDFQLISAVWARIHIIFLISLRLYLINHDDYFGLILDYLFRIYSSFVGISLFYLVIKPRCENTNGDIRG